MHSLQPDPHPHIDPLETISNTRAGDDTRGTNTGDGIHWDALLGKQKDNILAFISVYILNYIYILQGCH